MPAGVDQLEGCEISTDGRVLTVSNLGLGQTPYLFVVDIAAGSPNRDRVVRSLQLPSLCTDVVPSPDGSLAYAALAPLTGPGSVMVFDTTTGLPTAVVPNVGRFPTDLDLDPLGRFAYLACGVSGEVVRVDLRSDTGTFGSTLATPGLSQPFALALGGMIVLAVIVAGALGSRPARPMPSAGRRCSKRPTARQPSGTTHRGECPRC